MDAMLQAEVAETGLLHAIEARIERVLPQIEAAAEVAQALGLSERSLRRRLEAAGTSYREILRNVRFAIAHRRISGGRQSRDQIALDLGFDDARSLRRLMHAPGKVD